MINVKKLSIIALVLFLIGAIGSAFTFSQVTNQSATTEVKTISDVVTNINISADNATVEIIRTKGQETKVELVSKGVENSKLDFTADVDGKKLTVKLKNQLTFSFGFHIQSLHLKVYVPERAYKSLAIKSDNGKVKISDMKSEYVKVKSENGRIELNEILAKKAEEEFFGKYRKKDD